MTGCDNPRRDEKDKLQLCEGHVTGKVLRVASLWTLWGDGGRNYWSSLFNATERGISVPRVDSAGRYAHRFVIQFLGGRWIDPLGQTQGCRGNGGRTVVL